MATSNANDPLAVTPDGRYVFIDCPAGDWFDFIPTSTVHRFDVQARTLEVILDSGEDLGIEGQEGLIADEITMLPGGDAFALRDPVVAGIRIEEGEQDYPSLYIVDVETGAVRATYTPVRGEDGYVEVPILDLYETTIPAQ